jgi:hypothetical protein
MVLYYFERLQKATKIRKKMRIHSVSTRVWFFKFKQSRNTKLIIFRFSSSYSTQLFDCLQTPRGGEPHLVMSLSALAQMEISFSSIARMPSGSPQLPTTIDFRI